MKTNRVAAVLLTLLLAALGMGCNGTPPTALEVPDEERQSGPLQDAAPPASSALGAEQD